MPFAFMLVFLGFILAPAAPGAQGAVLTGQVDVQFFADGTDMHVVVVERQELGAWPVGAEAVTLSASWTDDEPGRRFVAGDVIFSTSGYSYLTGVLDVATLTFDDGRDFTMTSTMRVVSGPVRAFYASMAELQITGHLDEEMGFFLRDGPAFGAGTGTLTLAQVPLPGALPLFLSALGAAAIWRRRFRPT